MCFLDSVYKTFVISTIVDMGKYPLSLKSIKHL